MERVIPLRDKLLVRRLDVDNKTKGGIIVPETADESQKPIRGQVTKLGPGVKNHRGEVIPIKNINVGDVVLFQPHSGFELEVEDNKFMVLAEADVFGVVIEDGR